jgi:hypothetical protein
MIREFSVTEVWFLVQSVRWTVLLAFVGGAWWGLSIIGAWRLIKQAVDGRQHQLDVPDFLSHDACDEFVERPKLLLLFERDGLMQIVVECRHFSEPAAEQLLNGCGGIGIKFGCCG